MLLTFKSEELKTFYKSVKCLITLVKHFDPMKGSVSVINQTPLWTEFCYNNSSRNQLFWGWVDQSIYKLKHIKVIHEMLSHAEYKANLNIFLMITSINMKFA